MSKYFTHTIDVEDDIYTIKLIGDVDHEAGVMLRAKLRELLSENKMVVLDLNEVTYMADEGLGAIIGAFKNSLNLGYNLTFYCSNDDVIDRQIGRDLLTVLPFFQSLEEAKQHLGKTPEFLRNRRN